MKNLPLGVKETISQFYHQESKLREKRLLKKDDIKIKISVIILCL